MIKTENLFNILKRRNINFFSGVPDSILKNFSNFLIKYKKKEHFLAVNEGSAISIAAGYHLATKKIPCVYMQNSGLSNAINPLTSIVHKKVYSLPMLLIVGWRGSPKSKDEPQHMVKGKITPNLLRLLNIKFIILKNKKDLKKLEKLILFSKKNNLPVACLIAKNTLSPIKYSEKIEKKDNLRKEFIQKFLTLIPKDCKIISTTGYTSRELFQIRKENKYKNGKDFYMVGGMGHSSMVAMGVSIKYKKQVFCLDGDGSILMHMGSMRTTGNSNLINFKHILLNNNMHESVGEQLTSAKKINFQKLSTSLGYKKYFKINQISNSNIILRNFIKSKGPCFLEVKINSGTFKKLIRPKNLRRIKIDFIK
tara:strand:- start:3546 stop:4643 length:1098 start_codon:yes stop_codon:yes gene_type:complete